MKNASALSEARRREVSGSAESHNGALSIKPFERSRVTTLWELNGVFCAGWESVEEKGVWEGRRSEAEEVMGT
jgi:hypothetical protein